MKNNGYTFVETILAIGILSILMWSILPHIRRLELQGSLQFERIMEKSSVTRLVHALVTDLSQVRWAYWQASPSIEQEGEETRILWINESGEEKIYAVTRTERGIEMTQDENKRIFHLSSLKEFSLEKSETEETDLVVHLTTEYQQLSFPIRFGSKAIVYDDTQ